MTMIAEVLRLSSRLLRSIELERDFEDPAALAGYVLTPTARAHLQRVATALQPNSTRRAWRVTGDYGSGKSTFGLVLARLLCGGTSGLPEAAVQAMEESDGAATRAALLPVLVTGTRASVAAGVLRGLARAVGEVAELSDLRDRISEARDQGGTVQEELALRLLREVLRRSGGPQFGGVLLILDEVGKFLEAAALDPQRHDVYFLQQLAEMAARSGECPLIVLGLLHQGFHAYAESLTGTGQREWEKVAGRFEELLFDAPLEETAELVAGALCVDVAQLPASVVEEARNAMEQAHGLGWYGMANRERLVACAPRLFPLHPMTLPALARIFSRFGQNQRSLFTFLASNEPFGLQEFAAGPVEDGGFYRLHHLYDHVRATLGQRLVSRALRSHWFRVVGTIESLPVDEPQELEVVKTVGLLNLLDDERMLPREEALSTGLDTFARTGWPLQVAGRLRARRLLHLRGTAGGYRLWPHTSVDLERAYEDAAKALGSTESVSSVVSTHLETRPLVARRHYIETGNLRYFEVRYAPAEELARRLDPAGADGIVLVALCDTDADRATAIEIARSPAITGRTALVVAVPRPLSAVRDVVEELQRWEWVVENTPELGHDGYAAEEVSRHLRMARHALTERVRQVVGLHEAGGGEGICWFRGGMPVLEGPGQRITSYLSQVCDEVYCSAPHVHSELVNRAVLSSAAAAARMRIIEGVLRRPEEPLLGISPDKAPPEKAVYFSLFQRGKLHRQVDGIWTVGEPDLGEDPCRLRPIFEHIRSFLACGPDRRRSAAAVIQELRRPPYGVRDGLIPILLAVFAHVHHSRLAVYEDGAFMLDLTGFDFMRLIKAPNTFDFQLCALEGVRAEVFRRMVTGLGDLASLNHDAGLVEAVTQLSRFAAQLPDYTKRTRRISEGAQRVRSVLLEAEDPLHLLFDALPRVCELEPFDDTPASPERISAYVSGLRGAIGELHAAFFRLRETTAAHLGNVFGLPPIAATLQRELSAQAVTVRGAARDPSLVAFCSRLSDRRLPPEEWLDAVASVVSGKPPARWQDHEADLFPVMLHPYAHQFRQAAQIVLQRGDHHPALRGMCVSLTNEDGHQREMPLFFTPDAVEVQDALRAAGESLAGVQPTVKVAALTQLLWQLLAEAEAGVEGVHAA